MGTGTGLHLFLCPGQVFKTELRKTRQYNIYIFGKYIFLKYRTRLLEDTETNKYQAAIAVKISNLFIYFSSFDLSCSILEKDSFIENVYIVLSSLLK